MQYDELQYTIPDISAKVAAKQAVSVLESIAKADPGCLFYVIQPSNVLALAGMRAQSPYNDFEPTFNVERQELLAKILEEHSCALMYDRSPYDKGKQTLFSIISSQAFNQLPERYGIVKSFWVKPHKYDELNDFMFWSTYLESALVQKMTNNKLPKDWLLDWGAPHNIRFGMLLGYPGQAISTLCWNDSAHAKGGVSIELQQALLPFSGLYCGTEVSYVYAGDLENDRTIKKHQKLWSEVLKEVFAIFPESRLMKLPEFAQAFAKYRKYDEGL